MDAHPPGDEDDMNDLERRLANWQPAAERLGIDAMLFAAGHAAGRGGWGRRLWPACCVLLAVQAAGLFAWGLSERGERQALASRLHEQAPVTNVPAPPATRAEFGYVPSPDDYFHMRRRMEQEPSGGQASLPSDAPPVGQPLEPPILTPRQLDGLLEQ